MPLLKIETSIAIQEDKRKALLAAFSKMVSHALNKPEQYVMVTWTQAAIQMAGAPGDAAFVDVRGIGGLHGEANKKLTQNISQLLRDSLGIPTDRVYLNFTDIKAGNWGWNAEMFG